MPADVGGLRILLLTVRGGKTRPEARRADPNQDPCALRLHDEITPGLLLYYARNYRMPATLQELRQLPGFGQVQFTCPESGKPYGYTPDGLVQSEGRGRIVLYDSVPAHGGFRWTIEMTGGQQGKPPFANVVPVPEEHFQQILRTNMVPSPAGS